ncbi:MAG: hypothetical protein QMD50_00470 [Patescibacteria group bacterium]|nr:hypothetical protein [Patescibacteria group bacterium]
MRPIIKILIIAIILVIAGFIVYWIWNKITDQTEPPTESQIPTSTVPTIPPVGADLKLKKLSDLTVFDFVISNAGEIFYFSEDGKVLNAKEGSDIEILSQTVSALNFIEKAPGSEKILAAFEDPKNPSWGIFDLIDKVWRPLPQEIINATWGEKSTELITLIKNKNEINLSYLDVSKPQPAQKIIIKDFKLKDLKLVFKSPQTLLLIEKPSNEYLGRAWQLDLKKLTLNLIIGPEKGLVLKWSDDKSLALKFSSPDNLLVLDQNLKILTPPVFSTLPQKCAFVASKKLIYCFVPQESTADSKFVLPDDYLMERLLTVDNLISLNLETDETTKIFSSGYDPVSPVDVRNPQVLGNSIYFINRYDNYIYKLELPEQMKEEGLFLPNP